MAVSSLIQFQSHNGARGVAAMVDGEPRRVIGATTTLALAERACRQNVPLAQLLEADGLGGPVDLSTVLVLTPLDHPDPAQVLLSGTGLTHVGSAQERDRMHQKLTAGDQQSDSMKMFLMGLEGGRPALGNVGVQPEWFYKGNGTGLVAPGATLYAPDFAQDAGEEPEIAGLYLINARGEPVRIGYALGNEFSDHVTERENYLWLAHSKLRPAALGPELRLGELPRHITGTSRILREGRVLWEKPFLTGEDHMSHSLWNLEYHHFKYAGFRRPGAVHVHFFGTGTLSFGDGIRTQEGDVFEISASAFSLPLRNRLGFAQTPPLSMKVL